MKRLLFLIAIIVGCTCAPPPEPVKVSPLPPPEPVVVVQKVKAKRVKDNRCIFSEGIWKCRYDDRGMAKVGVNGVKPYDSYEIITDDNVGY